MTTLRSFQTFKIVLFDYTRACSQMPLGLLAPPPHSFMWVFPHRSQRVRPPVTSSLARGDTRCDVTMTIATKGRIAPTTFCRIGYTRTLVQVLADLPRHTSNDRTIFLRKINI